MTAPLQVLYTAAHAGFPDTEPLGGGKAVADYLARECRDWTVLSPQSIGIPLQKPLTDMSEREYARFSRQFERATTAEVLRHDPRQCVVVTNDISEGPDFVALRQYRLVSVWHVDVVDYFTKLYLRSWVRPETAARWSRHGWLPDLLKLVFHKQADCVRYSSRLVVPSAPMKDVIRRCYPDCPPERIVVLPWGNLAPTVDSTAEPAVDGVVIMTLSRLSPEKGIERLLAALPWVTGEFRVWICGAPAYMQGRRYEKKLRRLADGRVEFLGHVTGARKAALLRRADIFVSPSRHESYGLTIAEAQAAGCRVVSHGHYGATGTVVDCGQPRELARVLNELIRAGRTVKTSAAPVPSDAAQRLNAVLHSLAT